MATMISPAPTLVSSRRSTRQSSLGKKVMPDHWRLDNLPGPPWLAAILRLQFIGLCLISFGYADLETVWEISTADEATWTAHKGVIADRISTITVVTGLLLGATAAFVTTMAPLPEIINYSLRGPYLCLLASFAITLGGLITGSTLLFIMSRCQALWFRKTLMASRLRVCCTLISMGYPFCCTGAATLVMSFGLLAAGWLSEDKFLRIGCAFTMVMPASLAFLFCWMQIGHFIRYIKERAERGDSDDEESIKGEVKAEIKAEPESMIESPPNTAI